MWNQAEAVALCKKVESICPEFGCHVALTGGLLYKEGPRKDCDLLLYRIRQAKEIDLLGLWTALRKIGLDKRDGFGWVYKARYMGKPVDILMPEEQTGDYDPDFKKV